MTPTADVVIRDERKTDHDPIRALTRKAFAMMPFSDQTEAAIIDGLRRADALVLSLVAADETDAVLGHIAFSRVSVESGGGEWYGLGPLSVWPELQGHGLGQKLVATGLDRLKACGADGCVLVGDPEFYGRFGFTSDPDLTYADLPNVYVQRIVFNDRAPRGEISYHPAFEQASS